MSETKQSTVFIKEAPIKTEVKDGKLNISIGDITLHFKMGSAIQVNTELIEIVKKAIQAAYEQGYEQGYSDSADYLLSNLTN